MLDELTEAGLVKRCRNPRIRIRLGTVWQTDKLLQRNLRKLDILRRVDGPDALRKSDVAAAIRPQSVDRLDQRGLAATRLAFHIGPFAAAEPEVGRREERCGVVALVLQFQIAD